MPKINAVKSDNEILNNIFRLLKIKGARQIDLAKYIGISGNAISQWKSNTSASYMNYIDKLASFFDVTTDEIMHPDKTQLHDTFLSIDERNLIDNYRLLKNDQVKKSIVTFVSSLVQCPDLT